MKSIMTMLLFVTVLAAAQWKTDTVKGEQDGKKVIFSVEAVSGTGTRGESVAMSIECMTGEPPVIAIHWFSTFRSDTYVTHQFDAGVTTLKKWNKSGDGKTLFCPGQRERFLNNMLGSNTLTAFVKPYGKPQVTATFDVSGFSEAAMPYVALCGIKPEK